MKMSNVGIRFLVSFFFLINVLSIPCLAEKAMAAPGDSAAAAAAGQGDGKIASDNMMGGTIAAGAVIGAAIVLAIITRGGDDRVVAPTATPSAQAGTALATTNPAAASQAATSLAQLDTTDLSNLAAANTALGTAGQGAMAQAAAAGTLGAYLSSGGGFAVGSPQYVALQNLSASLTPAQLTAIQSMYAAAAPGGTVNTATLAGIVQVVSAGTSGSTPAQDAQNFAEALAAILTARHPGSTVTVTVTHLGGNVFTTAFHVR